jgi:hypothetical protein
MPPIFKALITISVWVLFIVGWLATLTTGVMIGRALMAGETPPLVAVANGGVGAVALILTCVGAWLRQKVE